MGGEDKGGRDERGTRGGVPGSGGRRGRVAGNRPDVRRMVGGRCSAASEPIEWVVGRRRCRVRYHHHHRHGDRMRIRPSRAYVFHSRYAGLCIQTPHPSATDGFFSLDRESRLPQAHHLHSTALPAVTTKFPKANSLIQRRGPHPRRPHPSSYPPG